MPRTADVAATSPPAFRIQVVAGILRDGEGRVLLTERIKDPVFSGLWEFPGGKIDAAEAPEAGLRRELAEELGIEVTQLERYATIEHDYPDRLVHIDFFLVTEWCDEIRAMDGQSLRWILPRDIDSREILPADVSIVEALRSAR